MSKDDIYSNCNPEMCRDEDGFADWDGECHNCDKCFGDDDDIMSIFSMAEIWYSNDKDEDFLFGYSKEELEDGTDG